MIEGIFERVLEVREEKRANVGVGDDGVRRGWEVREDRLNDVREEVEAAVNRIFVKDAERMERQASEEGQRTAVRMCAKKREDTYETLKTSAASSAEDALDMTRKGWARGPAAGSKGARSQLVLDGGGLDKLRCKG